LIEWCSFSFLKLECCGSSNYTDWRESEWKKLNPTKRVPLSCCKEGKNTSTCNNDTGFDSDNIHTKVMLWYSFFLTLSRSICSCTQSRAAILDRARFFSIPSCHVPRTHTHSRARWRARSFAPAHTYSFTL